MASVTIRSVFRAKKRKSVTTSTFSPFICYEVGFPGGSEDKAFAYNAGDPGSIPGLGRSPGEGNGNPLQYSCLKNPMDRGAWQATVHGVTKSQTRLNDFTHTVGLNAMILVFFFFLIVLSQLLERLRQKEKRA